MVTMGVAADMGAALAPEAGRRSRTHAQASSCRPARLLCPPHHHAGAEGLNSRIQAIRVSARGYCNRENFKTAIYFHCGGLDPYSQTRSIPG
jgi:hypothetical protein